MKQFKKNTELANQTHGKIIITSEENARRAGIKAFKRLRPVLYSNGTVTAENASGLYDGAAAVMLADECALSTLSGTIEMLAPSRNQSPPEGAPGIKLQRNGNCRKRQQTVRWRFCGNAGG